MGIANRKSEIKNVSKSVQLELIEMESLAYRRDYNPFWNSSLFDEIYLRNDVPNLFKNIWYPRDEESGPYGEFFVQLTNIAHDLKNTNLKSLNEENTINKVIKPVLNILGWVDEKKKYSSPIIENESFSVTELGKVKSYRPDILVFDSNDHVNFFSSRKTNEEKLNAARKHVIIPIEAKYWNRIEENRQNQKSDKTKIDKNLKDDTLSSDFEGQTLKYMSILNKQWGILTDGYTWRLFNSELNSESQRRSFQFNLGHLLQALSQPLSSTETQNKELWEQAKYFYNFFCKDSFLEQNGNDFLNQLIQTSKKYASTIEYDLKQRFLKSISIVCNGYSKRITSLGEEQDLEIIRNCAESLLFNIFFIKFCETKNILPVKQAPHEYRLISISNAIEKLKEFNPEGEAFGLNDELLKNMFSDFKFSEDGFELYNRLLELTEIVENGSGNKYSGFEIQGFKQVIFASSERKFIYKYKLTNKEMVKTYFELGYKKEGSEYKQIPYNFFSPRQLGSIYESFLEFKLEKAETDLAFIKNQWQRADLSNAKIKKMDIPKAKKGELFFSPNNKERKATGSFYTPDYVVQEIVSRILDPMTEKLGSKEIEKLRVVDPAMGSGHFLSGALNYLAKKLMQVMNDEHNDDSLTYEDAKRVILPKCLVGIDINSRAAKLAKMSLWLESAVAGKTLEPLDEQLVVADTIFTKNILSKVKHLISPNGITAVIGNPPYGIDFSEEEVAELFKRFKTLHQKHDSYHVFIERILLDEDWLQYCNIEKYRVGLIVPDTILSLDCFKKLREQMLESNFNIDFILNKYDVFEDAKVSTLLMLVNGIREKEPVLRMAKSILPTDLSEVVFEEISIDDSRSDKTNRFIVRSNNPLDKFKNTIADYFEGSAGAQAYEVGKGTPKQTKQMLEDKIYNSTKKIDKSYRPYLYGSDISAMIKTWKNSEFVKYGHNLSAPRDPWFHTGDRVVVQRIRNPKLKQRLVASFINDDSVSSVGLSILKPIANLDKKVSSKALSVYLNLPTVNAWYSQINNDVNIKPTVLKTIPIKEDFLEPGGMLDSAFDTLTKIAAKDNESELREVLSQIDSKLFKSGKAIKKAA